MTQKQFNAIKAQIEKTDKMINKAITEVKSDIEKRVDKLIEKMIIIFPILIQTVKECGMECCRFQTDNFEGVIHTKYAENSVRIIINQNNKWKTEVYNFVHSSETLKDYLTSKKDNFVKEFEDSRYSYKLADLEQFFLEIKNVQSSIRENTIKYFQEISNDKMEQLTNLQKI